VGMVWRIGRRSCGAKATAGRDELGGATHGELPPPMLKSKQEQRDAGPTCNAGLTADSIRFHRRVRMQGNRPRTCRLGAVDVGAKQKQRTGDANVPAVSQRHTCVSKEDLPRE
jgi:hypothetical protein